MSLGELLDLVSNLPQWQLALAATWLLLQGCLVPSVPEEILMLALGVLVGQGRIDGPVAMAAVLAGLLPANATTVLLGALARRGAGRSARLSRLLASSRVEIALDALRRHGPSLVVATRFLPLVRGPVYLAVGASGLGLRRFAALDGAAAVVQVPVVLWIGARLGADVTPSEAWSRIGWVSAGLAGVAAGALGVRHAAGRWGLHRALPRASRG